jgi:hypothetical protein
VVADKLAADAYPYGGAQHAETIKFACLAAMEKHKFQLVNGPNEVNYRKLLALSRQRDQRGTRAASLGFLVNARPKQWRRGAYAPQARNITVGGVSYP